MNRQELLAIIQQAKDEKWTTLDLSGKEIIELPQEIGQLTALQQLDLSHNQLESLPSDLGQLTALQKLHLMDNRLSSLSSDIGQLSSLQELDLGFNQLNSLPSNIGQLVVLQVLYLSYNQFSILPTNIGHLKNLRKLDLSNNRLNSLSSKIGHLKSLRKLYLNNNRLDTLPQAIGQLSKLQSLNLSGNQLSYLPENIGKLTNLDRLNLSVNQLKILPLNIGHLKNLQRLILSGNQLSSLPENIGQLASLKQLHLIDNQLSYIPQVIGQLRALERLYLSYNQLSDLPLDIGRLKALQQLDLDGNNLTDLPADIGQLTALQQLHVDGNNLTNLPTEIGQLTALERLYLSRNRLDSIPSSVGQLRSLKQLCLSHNQLSNLPSIIGQLTALKWLHLDDNQLSDLPPNIGQLKALQQLHLDGNKLSNLPPDIEQLTALEVLYLSRNQLKNFPPVIGKLKSLQKLYLSHNQLSSLPSVIEQLTSLQLIHLDGNKLSGLPSNIGSLKTLQQFLLDNNQLVVLPPEINGLINCRILSLKRNPGTFPASIAKLRKHGDNVYVPKNSPNLSEDFLEKPIWDLDCYLRDGEGAMHPINEAKLILIGDDLDGRTCLAKHFLHGKAFQKNVGINQQQWEYITINGHQIRLNVWSFGDREVLRNTHQFFLTKRSVYVLVLNALDDKYESRLEYWLKLIQSFGSDSPMLIAINQLDKAHHVQLNERFLTEKYSFIIKGFYPISCATGEGVTKLKQDIQFEVGKLPHIHELMPTTWFTLKQSIENHPENYISYSDYHDLCLKHKILEQDSQSTLCAFLHDLGIVLNFRDDERLKDTIVLNPEWVTNAVYKLLDNLELFKKHGIFSLADLTRTLENDNAYSNTTKHPFIIDMMQKFELCFPITDTPNYLLPELLQNEEPDLDRSKDDSLRFEYHYDILPHSVFSRFVVRLHRYISKTTYWRTGVVLTYEKNKALIKADLEDRKIFVWVSGKTRTRGVLLGIVRKEFNYIHGTIKGLEAKEKVPYKNVTVDYQHLLDLEEMGEEYFIPEGLKEKVSVQFLLAGVDNRMIKQKIFLASSSELKADRRQFEIFINRKNKVLVDKGIFLELVIWEDLSAAMSATRLQDEYNIAVREADIFVMLYCSKVGKYTEEEFTVAWENFKMHGKPLIFIYFNDTAVTMSNLKREEIDSLLKFQDLLKNLEHFATGYTNIDALLLNFTQQLEKLGIA